jgi:DNA-binding transcriptional MerR regulator
MRMNVYSIKDLENFSGIKAHTIRIWEQRYHLLSPVRTETGIRTYSDIDLKRILNIATLQNKGGIKISKIAELTESEISEKILQLSGGELDYPEHIQAITVAMMDLDEYRFQVLAKTITDAYGFENFMLKVIYPFLTRLGTLWLSGSVGPAQEHFITHLIRQKIIAAIDSQMARPKPDAKKFLLYLPEGELHEIGLLFASYLIRARQHSVVYLGQSLPFDELCLAYEIHQPDYVFSVFTTEPSQDILPAYVANLDKMLPDAKIMLTGYNVLHSAEPLPTRIQLIGDFTTLIELIES